MDKKIVISNGDITQFKADAMGNAANSSLAGGGGVDGAIHRAAGPELLRELSSNYPNGCPTGGAVITKAYGKLRADYVIHAVGPVWHGGNQGEEELLYSAYLESFKLAEKNGCSNILMPAISCGVYGYPHVLAAEVAVNASRDFLKASVVLRKIEFVLFTDEMVEVFKRVRATID